MAVDCPVSSERMDREKRIAAKKRAAAAVRSSVENADSLTPSQGEDAKLASLHEKAFEQILNLCREQVLLRNELGASTDPERYLLLSCMRTASIDSLTEHAT